MILSDKLKKFSLAGLVVLSYALYTFSQRHDSSAPVLPPTTTQAPASSESSSTSSNSPAVTSPQTTSYQDGTYTGNAADAYYGNIQVKAVIKGGKISDVIFLQYPNDRSNSVRINTIAMPYLKQEAIQSQDAQVDTISGATDTSMAFRESLGTALTQAVSQ